MWARSFNDFARDAAARHSRARDGRHVILRYGERAHENGGGRVHTRFRFLSRAQREQRALKILELLVGGCWAPGLAASK